MSETWKAEQTVEMHYWEGSNWFTPTCRCGKPVEAKVAAWDQYTQADVVGRARAWCRGCGQRWKFEYVAYDWRRGVTVRLIPDGIHWSFVQPPTLESLVEQVADLSERVKALEEDRIDRECEAEGYGE